MDLDLRSLRHAHALAETGSFARAAKLRHLSQPALSRSIQLLEERVGAKLFERTSTGVTVTDLGRLFLAQSRDLLSQADQLAHDLELIKGAGSMEIVIGCGPYPADLVLARAVGQFSARHPRVRVRLIVSDPVSVVAMVRKAEVHVGIAELTLVPSGDSLEVEPLARHQGYFMVRSGHPLVHAPAPSLAQILSYPMVLTSRLPPRVLAPLLKAGAAQSQLDAMPAIAVESIPSMKAIVEYSDAVTPLPLASAVPELESGRLHALDRIEPWAQTHFGFVRLRARPRSELEITFCEAVRALDAELVAKDHELRKRFGMHASAAAKVPAIAS